MEDLNQIKDKVILHSDVNNFFASVECSLKPELKGKAVAVAGNPLKRTGIILAKNEIAKKMGVKTGQVIGEAMALCPDLICLPPHFDLYEKISQELIQLYLGYTNFVEPLGMDECWLDITGCEQYLHKSGKEIADEIREKIKQKFNFTVSIGVSFSKIFAKLGSDLKKPDYTTVIDYDNYKNITYKLPLNSIIGIGRKLEKKFSSIDVKTIGDFVKLDDNFIHNTMGKNGKELKDNLMGLSSPPVMDYYKMPAPKSIGNGTTTAEDIVSRDEIKKVISFLTELISKRLINHEVFANTISITIKNSNLKTFHKSIKISPTNSLKELTNEALKLADSIWNYNTPVRAIRINTSSFSSANIKQLSLFDTPKKDISNVMNNISNKYGKIELASDYETFLNKSGHFHKNKS